jgi:hypothetical protein
MFNSSYKPAWPSYLGNDTGMEQSQIPGVNPMPFNTNFQAQMDSGIEQQKREQNKRKPIDWLKLITSFANMYGGF